MPDQDRNRWPYVDGIDFLLGATVWAFEGGKVRVVPWTKPTGTARTALAMEGGHGPRIPGDGWGDIHA